MKNKRNRGLIWSAFLGLALSSLTVQAQNYTNKATGNWSVVGSWSSGVPPTGGGYTNTLVFTNSGAVLSTNNIADGSKNFTLNQLIFTNAVGALTIQSGAGTNLVFTNNGAILPTVWQYTATNLTFNHLINLATNTTFGGSGSGTVALNSNVFGSGGLTMNGTNYVLVLAASNSYAGVTTLNAGTLVANNKSALSTNVLVMSGGVLSNSVSSALANTVSLQSNGTVGVLSGQTLTLGGMLTNTGTLVVNGVGGTLVLAGSNSYTGGTMLQGNGANALTLSNNNALGTGSLTLQSTYTLSGNTLLLAGGLTITNALIINAATGREGIASSNGNTTLSGPITINSGGNTTIFDNMTANTIFTQSGGITAGSGFTGLVSFRPLVNATNVVSGVINLPAGNTDINGAGTLIITTNGNTWTSVNFNNTGNIVLGINNALCTTGYVAWTSGTSAGALNLNGYSQTVLGLTSVTNGVLTYIGTITNGGASASTLTFSNATSTNFNFGGRINDGSQPISLVLNAGTQILSGTNTYSGGTIINSGVLQVGSSTASGTLGSGTVSNFATLVFSRSDIYTNANLIAGTGTLIQSGAGTLVLTNVNSYTGATLITSGTLRADLGVGMPTQSAVTLSNAIWETGGSITNALGTNGSQLQILGGTAGFSAFGSTATINLGNAGTTLLWGTNLFNPTVLVLNGNTANTNLIFANGLDLNAAARTIAVSANVATITGVITNSSGTSGLTKGGAGTLVLAATNSYNGVTTINAGTLSVGYLANGGSPSGLGSANNNVTNLVLAGGTLQYTGPNVTIDRGMRLTAGSTIDIATNLNISGVVTGAFTLVKTGVGMLTLSGAGDNNALNLNATNGVAVLAKASTTGVHGANQILGVASGATLQMGGTGQYQINSYVTNMNGTLDLKGLSQIMGGLSGAGLVTNTTTTPLSLTLGNNNSYGLFSGTIADGTGQLSFIKTGTSTQVLSGPNNYTGGTTINGGNLQFNTLTSVPTTGFITINVGGALNATGAYTTASWLTSGSIATNSAGTFALTAYNNAPLDFASSNFANLYLGAVGTVTNNGTITPANNTYRLGGGGTLVITNNLALTGSRDVVINNLGLNGTVTLTGSNDYTGATTIINSLNPAGNTPVIINNSDAFGQSSVLFSNTVANSGQNLNYQFNGGTGSLVITNALTLDGSVAARMRLVSQTGSNILTGPITLKSIAGGGSVGFYGNGLGTNGSWTILGDIDGTQLNGNPMYMSGAGTGKGGYLLGNVNLSTNRIGMETGGGTGAEWYIGAPGKTYSWGSIQVNGILHLLTSGVLPTNSYLNSTHNGDMVIDLNGTTQQIAYINTATWATNVITNCSVNAAALTIAGSAANRVIFTGTIADGPGGGTISLTLGGGTMTLVGSNTYSGGTIITNGTLLLVSSTNTFGTGTLTLGSDVGVGTTYAVDQTFVSWITNQAGTAPGIILLGANSASNLTFGGSLSNTFLGAIGGAYTYSGSATWADNNVRLGGGNSNLIYSSAVSAGTNLLVGPIGGNAAIVVTVTNAAHNPDTTTIQSGTLQVGNNSAGTLGTGTVSIASGATLTFYNNGTMTNTSGTISGSGMVTARGSVVYMLSSNAYTGGTFLNGGNVRLALGNDNALGSGTITFSSVGNNPTLSSTGSAQRTLANNIVIGTNTTFGTAGDNGTLVFTGSVDLTGGTRTLTTTAPVIINGAITNGGLTKAGTAQLTLAGTNTYTLGTTLSAGTLSIGDYVNLPVGTLTITGGSTLQIIGNIVTNLDPYVLNAGTFNGGFDIASATNTLTIGTNLSGAGISAKNGPGTLVLTGTNTFTGTTSINAGALVLQGNGVLSNGAAVTLNVGTVAGNNAVLVVQDNARLSYTAGNGILYVGVTGAGAVGAVYQSDNSIVNVDGLTLSRIGGSYGYYALNNGALNVAGIGGTSRLRIGESNSSTNGTGVFYMFGGNMNVGTGGTLSGSGFDIAGGANNGTNCIGVVYIAGGILSNSFANNISINVLRGQSNNRAEMTVDGTAFVTAPTLNFGSGGTGTGILNLNGGTLALSNTTANAASLNIFNFNGGTLQAVPRAASAFLGSANLQAYIYTHGVTIDSGTNNITISQSLLSPTGNGVTVIPMTNFGSGYIGAPYVQITGGGGSNATAIALVDPVSQTVTNILITNPGFGYTDAPTITLIGGGGCSAAATGNFSSVSSGGLTKLGSGTLTLSGLNTFTGDIAISNGAVAFNRADTITISNLITGAGLLIQAGTGTTILANANSYAGGTILSAGTLSIGDYVNLPTTGPLIFNGGILQITGTIITNDNLAPYAVNWTNFNGGFDLASAANTLTINTNLTSTSAFYKYGDGTLIMGSTNSLTGGVNVRGGTLEIGSIASLTNSGMTVGGTTTATLHLDNGGKIFATGDSIIGNTSALNGTVIQDGGIFTSSAALRLATSNSATVAAYQMNGGTINLTNTATSYLQIGRDGVGTFTQAGGTVTVARTATGWSSGALILGMNAGATGIYTLAGGTLNVTNNTANSTTVIGYGGTGFLTISNAGTVANLAGPIVFGANGGTGTVNLAAGELRFTSMFVGTTSGLGTFNWSGGTLRPFSSDAVISNNLPLTLTGAGATFNTLDAFSNARTVTVFSAIGENGGSYGLTKIGAGNLILGGTNTFTGGINLLNGGIVFSSTSAIPSSVASLFVPYAASVGVGYALDQAFLGTISNASAGTVALGGNSSNPLDFTSLANVSLGTINGTWTNSGGITPFGTTYNLGGGGGTLVVTTVLTDQVAGATSLLAFGSGSGGIVVLAATNTYTGNTTLVGGELSIGSYSNLPLASPLIFNGGILQITGTIVTNDNLAPYAINWTNFNGGFDIADNGVVVTITTNIGGPGALTKLGGGTLVLSGTNSYAGSTLISGGLLQIGAGATTGTLGLGNVTNNATLAFNRSDTYTATNLISGAGTITLIGGGTLTAVRDNNLPTTAPLVLGNINSAGNYNLNGFNQTVASLAVVGTNASLTNTITIGSGQTLTINGSGGLTVGFDSGTNSWTVAKMTGGGALVVTNTGASVIVGKRTADDAVHNHSTLDLSALSSVTLGSSDGALSVLSVGYDRGADGTLILSDTNNLITATTVRIGHSNNSNGGPGTIILGAGTNVIAADTIQIGLSKAYGTLQFASQDPGSPGTVTIGGKTGAAANITIGSRNSTSLSTTSAPIGTLDLRGHTATVTAGNVSLGLENGASSGDMTGNLFFDAGTFTVSNLNMAAKSGSGSGDDTATLTVSGGVFTVQSGGSFTLASKTSGTGSINGYLNVLGGVFNSYVDIRDGGGTATSTINLNGGTLDMHGRSIGTAGTNVDTFNLQSGTLMNLGEFNDGAPLVKTTSGTLVLSNNTYSGNTTNSAGTLIFADQNAVLNSTVVMNGGTNVFNAPGTNFTFGGLAAASAGPGYDIGLTNNAGSPVALTVGGNGSNTTYGGALSGGGSLTKAGAGTLTLTNADTYTGGTTLNAGSLLVNNNNALGSGTLTIAGGKLSTAYATARTLTNAVVVNGDFTIGATATNAPLTLSGAMDLGGGTRAITVAQVSNGYSVISGQISNGALTIGAGAGGLILSGNNIYAGDTVLNNTATLQVSSDANLGVGTNLTINQNGVLTTTGNMSTSKRITFIGASTQLYVTNGTTLTLNGVVGGTGQSPIKNGAGTLVLNASNQFADTSVFLIKDGTLKLGNTYALNRTSLKFNPAGSHLDNSSGSALTALGMQGLHMTSGFVFDGTSDLDLSGGVAGFVQTANSMRNITVTSNTLTITGIRGSGTAYAGTPFVDGVLGKYGAGTLVMTDDSTYTLGTLISAGTLQAGNGSAAGSLGTGAVTNNGNLVYNRPDIFTVNNVISGAGNLIMNGTGTLTLSSTNTYIGATTLSAGELSIGSYTNIALGNTINFNGGILQVTGTSVTDLNPYVVNNSSFNGGFDIVDAGNVVTLTNNLSGPGSLTKLGAGTLTLASNNTYNGATVISNGTLKVANTVGALSSSTAVYVDNLGLIDFSGNIQTIAGLTGNGVVTNGGGNLTLNLVNATNTFGGTLQGASTLTLTGGGSLIMTGTNNFGGATLVNDATYVVNGLHNGGVITVNSNGFVGGVGTIATTLNILSNGFYSPGATLGLGTQTVANLTLNPGGLLAVGLTTASNGLARVSTSFAMTNALLRLDLTQYTFVANQTFVVMNYTNTAFTVTDPSQWFTLQDFGPSAQPGQVLSNDLTFGVSGGLLNTTNFFRINYDALANGDPGGSMITLTAVPEPGTASLLGLIGVAFLVRRLRRRRAQS